MSTCKYDPQILPTGTLTPPAATMPSLVRRDHITLSDGTLTVDLKTPEYGDTVSFNPKRIQRRSRGGTLIVQWDQSEYSSETISVVIQTIRDSDLDGLKAFILANLGKYITYTDYESRDWSVILINPEEVINRENRCYSSIRLQFFGALA